MVTWGQYCSVIGYVLDKRPTLLTGLPGLFPSRKRVMSVKGTECSELCGVLYVKPRKILSEC